MERETLEKIAREKALDQTYGGMFEADYDCFSMFADSDKDYVNTYNEILEGLLEEYAEREDDFLDYDGEW